jgi:amino acid transporter/mannitol/fructose-specific phosphotransferase system IIA component (Ntr-type)
MEWLCQITEFALKWMNQVWFSGSVEREKNGSVFGAKTRLMAYAAFVDFGWFCPTLGEQYSSGGALVGQGLERNLGVVAVIAISVGAMLGSGIFVLPGIAATMTGPSVPLAYFIAAICVLPAALSKAELATAMPTSGGTYVYISRAFGPLPGTIAGLGLWLSLLFKSAFALVGLSAYLKVIAPHVDLLPVSLGILFGVTILNIFGVRAVSRMQMFVVAAALIFLFALAGSGVTMVDEQRYHPFLSSGVSGLLEAAAFVTVSFAGVTKVAAIAEEVRDPGRNLPIAMLVSLGLVSIIYVCVVGVLVGVVDIEILGQGGKMDAIPMVHLSSAVWGVTGGVVASVLGILTMASMANAGLMASSRFPFAMSRDKLIPSFFQKIHPRLLTPHTCILVTGFAMALAILFLDVEKLAKLASAFKILIFMIVNATVIVFRQNQPDWYKPEFKSPLYPWIHIFGILVGAVLINSLGSIAMYAAGGITVAGSLLFFAYAKPRIHAREALKIAGAEDVVVDLVHQPPVLVETHLQSANSLTLLFGQERSPEKLVEISAALSMGGRQEVVHIKEIPEQTALGVLHDDGPDFVALRRRVERVAQERGLDLRVDGIVSHDIDQSVPNVIEEVDCNWTVLEWSGPAHHNFIQSRQHWSILDHSKSNLALYTDSGVHDIRQILVYAEPDLYDDMVTQAADSLARLFGAELTFVRCVRVGTPPVIELAQVDYVDQLRMSCKSKTHSLIVRGKNEVQAVESVSKGFDLLVMATDRPRPFVDFMKQSPKDHLTENAACSVLRLKPQETLMNSAPFDPEEDSRMRLVDVLDSEVVETGLTGFGKDSLYRHIADRFEDLLGIPSVQINQAFWDHEIEHNTSIGDGAALPHATLDGLDHDLMGIFILDDAIDFDSPDGRDCDVFVVTLSSPEERHTHQVLQRKLSSWIMDSSLIEDLRQCRHRREVLEIFNDLEEAPDL